MTLQEAVNRSQSEHNTYPDIIDSSAGLYKIPELNVVGIPTWDRCKNGGIRLSPTKKQIYRYIIEGSPYEVEIVDGETYNMIEGYGTGFGDLWEWSYYSSFSKEDADAYYLEELERVKEKYKI